MDLLIEGIKAGVFTLSVMYLSIYELRNLLLSLKIDTTAYESTQLFRQVIPFKTLCYDEITKEVEPSLLKFATKNSPGLER